MKNILFLFVFFGMLFLSGCNGNQPQAKKSYDVCDDYNQKSKIALDNTNTYFQKKDYKNALKNAKELKYYNVKLLSLSCNLNSSSRNYYQRYNRQKRGIEETNILINYFESKL